MSHRRRGRGESSDSDSKLKYGINIGILASGSAPTHGAGPSGHTTTVRVFSSNITADEEASTETPEDIYMDLDDTPPVEQNGTKMVNGASRTTSTFSSPKEIKEWEAGVGDMIVDNILADESAPSKSSPITTPSGVDSAHISPPAD